MSGHATPPSGCYPEVYGIPRGACIAVLCPTSLFLWLWYLEAKASALLPPPFLCAAASRAWLPYFKFCCTLKRPSTFREMSLMLESFFLIMLRGSPLT